MLPVLSSRTERAGNSQLEATMRGGLRLTLPSKGLHGSAKQAAHRVAWCDVPALRVQERWFPESRVNIRPQRFRAHTNDEFLRQHIHLHTGHESSSSNTRSPPMGLVVQAWRSVLLVAMVPVWSRGRTGTFSTSWCNFSYPK